jgi:diacylglycerol kinase family enzyme
MAMNAEWLGEWKVAPRAHPGDGLLDVLDGDLPLRERLRARRLARTGDHLPHPRLATARVRQHTVRFQRPVPVWLDGVRVGRARVIDLTVEPDALAVVV